MLDKSVAFLLHILHDSALTGVLLRNLVCATRFIIKKLERVINLLPLQ
jgi:hypothetical protein